MVAELTEAVDHQTNRLLAALDRDDFAHLKTCFSKDSGCKVPHGRFKSGKPCSQLQFQTLHWSRRFAPYFAGNIASKVRSTSTRDSPEDRSPAASPLGSQDR